MAIKSSCHCHNPEPSTDLLPYKTFTTIPFYTTTGVVSTPPLLGDTFYMPSSAFKALHSILRRADTNCIAGVVFCAGAKLTCYVSRHCSSCSSVQHFGIMHAEIIPVFAHHQDPWHLEQQRLSCYKQLVLQCQKSQAQLAVFEQC